MYSLGVVASNMYVTSGEVHNRPAEHLSVPQLAAEWRDPTVYRVIYSSDGALWEDERFGEVASFGFNPGGHFTNTE